MHNTGCRYGNWQPDYVHGPRFVTRDQLQLPVDRVPWNAEHQCGVRRRLEHCLGFNDGPSAAAATAATPTTPPPTPPPPHPPPPPPGTSNEPAGMTLIDQRPFNSLAEHAAPYFPAWDTDPQL